MRVIVPDASVLLKWVLPESGPEQDAALELRDAAVDRAVDLLVPPLWLYEVGNALTRRVPEQAGELLDSLIAFGLVERTPTDAWRRQVLRLTARCGATFYDAAYHALAIVERGVFVTADRAYVSRAKGAGAAHLLGA